MSKRPGDPGYAAEWCIHFRSMGQHDTCEKGVNYEQLAGGRAGSFQRLPCFIKTSDVYAAQRVKCEHFRPPTAAEIVAHEEWLAERIKRLRVVLGGILPWRLAHKGKSASEIVECPACKGRLHLAIAASNGHVHGSCKTEGCVRWAE
jgi:hypothetical protein